MAVVSQMSTVSILMQLILYIMWQNKYNLVLVVSLSFVHDPLLEILCLCVFWRRTSFSFWKHVFLFSFGKGTFSSTLSTNFRYTVLLTTSTILYGRSLEFIYPALLKLYTL